MASVLFTNVRFRDGSGALRSGMSTSYVERIAVETDGSGDPVLMIHGLGGTSNVWTPVLPALARFRAVRPDLPGSGRSHRVEGALSIDRFVRALMRVCGATGVERAHVVAHSMGTIVAFHLAAARAEAGAQPGAVRPAHRSARAEPRPDPGARREGAQGRRIRHAGDRRRASCRRPRPPRPAPSARWRWRPCASR